METILGIFVIAHGLVHSILAVAPTPNDPNTKPGWFFTSADRSWLLPHFGMNAESIKWVGLILVVLSTIGFVFAGLGILGVAGISSIWRLIVVVAAVISLLLLFIFWHSWLPVGVLINIIVLVAVLWAKWPSVELIGS